MSRAVIAMSWHMGALDAVFVVEAVEVVFVPEAGHAAAEAGKLRQNFGDLLVQHVRSAAFRRTCRVQRGHIGFWHAARCAV